MKKFFQKLITKILLSRGYSTYFAYKVFEERVNDFFKNKNTTLKQKFWAQRRGFLSKKIGYYGLTNENYHDYLSDFDYFKLHPINGIFSHCIDDKLIMKLILYPFSEYLPGYYFHLTNNEVLRLADCHEDYPQSLNGILNLLKDKGTLALKLCAGTKGAEFSKLSYNNDAYFINDNTVEEQDLISKLEELSKSGNTGYLITEYLEPCRELSVIWPKTPNTIRVSVIREKNSNPTIVNSCIGFGTQKTGSIDSSIAGGITCRVDLDTGYYYGAVFLEHNLLEKIKRHPDSNQLVEGYIPNWLLIKEKIIEISNYLPQLIHMGFDIVVTEEGFKIIEINSHEGIGFNQTYNPYLKQGVTKAFYTRLIQKKK